VAQFLKLLQETLLGQYVLRCYFLSDRAASTAAMGASIGAGVEVRYHYNPYRS
jgi:hypothetical protein